MADKNDDGSVDEVTKCPDCGSTHLKRDYDHAEIVCADTTRLFLGLMKVRTE